MRAKFKIKNILIIAYILFVIFGAYYIRSISKYTKIDQLNENRNQPIKSKPAEVSLIVNNSKTYKAILETEDSISYMLDQLRKDKTFDYEKTQYTYGTEINSVSGQNAPEGYKWIITINGNDVTSNISDTKLTDQAVYQLNLIKL